MAGETFAAIDALTRYGADTWFRLGDRDLATHLFRTQLLGSGATLSEATARITEAWGLAPRLVPMSDDRIATRIATDSGELAMQEWFVRERCEPPVVGVRFEGADVASAAPGVLDAIHDAETILICPSNPVISIAPILAVAGVRDALVAAARTGRRREPDHRGPTGEGTRRSVDGPAGHRRVVRRGRTGIPRVLQHARDRRR